MLTKHRSEKWIRAFHSRNTVAVTFSTSKTSDKVWNKVVSFGIHSFFGEAIGLIKEKFRKYARVDWSCYYLRLAAFQKV